MARRPRRYEWDEAKSDANLKRRNFDFAYAAAIFTGTVFEAQDTRRNYGEVRMTALGQANDDVLLIVYTDRGDTRRILSARRAKRKERSQWRSFVER